MPRPRDAVYIIGNRPAPGIIPAVLKKEQDDPNTAVEMTSLPNILRCMKQEKMLSASTMRRLNPKAVFEWFDEGDYVMVSHDHFDPLPSNGDVRAAIKKLFRYARKPYEKPYERRPKRAFTPKNKAANDRKKRL